MNKPIIRAALLISGNEVLYGKTRDTNGPYLARVLRESGLEVTHTLTCGDDKSALVASLKFLSDQVDLIIMTGGLGPTSDDLTTVVLGEFFKEELVFFPEAWENVTWYFQTLGRKEIPESNRKQALLPASSKVLRNPRGTAAGFQITKDNISVVALPGVPMEMEIIFQSYVLPLVAGIRVHASKTWQVYAMGESTMQSMAEKWESALVDKFPAATISYQAHPRYVTYSFAILAQSNEEKNDFLTYLENILGPDLEAAFKGYVLYRTPERLNEYVVRQLTSKSLSLSIAESCTGGGFTKEICRVPGASKVFMGGFVSYSVESKEKVLKIPKKLIDTFGVYSRDVAGLMAEAACSKFETHIGVGITGVAGPQFDDVRFPVGTVSIAIAINENLLHEDVVLQDFVKEKRGNKIIFQGQFQLGKGLDRQVIQTRGAANALASLCLLLGDLSS